MLGRRRVIRRWIVSRLHHWVMLRWRMMLMLMLRSQWRA